MTLKLESFTTSKTDRHLLSRKVRQRISAMKTNPRVFDVFKTKRELKVFMFSLLRFFDELFDMIKDDLFLTL